MANQPGYQTRILVGEWDLSGYTTGVSYDQTRDQIDVTVMQPAGTVHDREFLAGLATGTISIDGLLDYLADGSDEILDAVMDGTEQVISVSFEGGNTVGDRAVLLSGYQTGLGNDYAPDDALRFTSGRQGTAAVTGGIILHEHAAETGAGNSAGVDHASSTAYGGVAHLHVTAFSGSSAVVKVTDSVDDGTYADLVTFTTVTDVTSERKTATGTVNRWARCEITGTFTSITFTVSFARHNQ